MAWKGGTLAKMSVVPLPEPNGPSNSLPAPKATSRIHEDGDAHPMNPSTIGCVPPQGSYSLEGGNPYQHLVSPSHSSPAPQGLPSSPYSPKDLEGGIPCQKLSNPPPSPPTPISPPGTPTALKAPSRGDGNSHPKNSLTIGRVGPQGSYGLEGGGGAAKFSTSSLPLSHHPKAPQGPHLPPKLPLETRKIMPPQRTPRPSDAWALREAMAWTGGTPPKISAISLLLPQHPEVPQIPFPPPELPPEPVKVATAAWDP